MEIARSTADPKDDDLVSKLDDTRGRLDDIGAKLGPLGQKLSRHASQTTSIADLARKAITHFTSRRSRFPEDFSLQELVQSIVDGDANTEQALGRIAESHVKQPLLVPSRTGGFDGWFAELSSHYDPELGAVSVRSEGSGIDSEMIVYDHHGRVLHRRVRRRRTPESR